MKLKKISLKVVLLNFLIKINYQLINVLYNILILKKKCYRYPHKRITSFHVGSLSWLFVRKDGIMNIQLSSTQQKVLRRQ